MNIDIFIARYNRARSFREALKLTGLTEVAFRNQVARVRRREDREQKSYFTKYHSKIQDMFNKRIGERSK